MPTVADLMALTGIVPSKSAARRAIAEGGAYLNNRKVTAEDAVPERGDLLHGRYLVAAPGQAHGRCRRRPTGLSPRAGRRRLPAPQTEVLE